jgi:hypothetical protein
MRVLNLDQLTAEENKEYNLIALSIRYEYNQLIQRISEDHINNIHWIVGSIASRNKYQSQLFYRCCQLILIQKILEREEDLSEVILNDRPMARLLKKEFKGRVKVICSENFKSRVWRIFRPFRQFLIAFFFLILRYLGRSSKGKIANKNRPLILVDTFVLNNKAGDEGSITDGKYKDRYYPGLLDNLTAEQKENVFFLPTIVGFTNPISIFRKIRSAEFPFLLHDDYLNFSDYLFAVVHPFKAINLEINNSVFSGVDMRSVIEQEKRRNCSDFISILGLLYYRFPLRLKENGIKVSVFIEWYENQVMDRGMIVGFHKYMPTTTILGYQGYIISKGLHLYTQPNDSEYNGGAVPDFVCVTGKGLVKNIHEFCQRVKVEVAPGFRFKKLWQDRKQFPNYDFYTILIGLPIGLSDCKEILELFTFDNEFLFDENLKILIKPHPTWSPDVIKSLLPQGSLDRFSFILGDFHVALEKVNLVVSNASSVALEALAKGTPVIIISPSTGILQNPIPEEISTDFWSVCSTTQEIKSQIKIFKEKELSGGSDFIKFGDQIRADFFEPVTYEGVQKFIALKKNI